jgi:hypothetical protein
LNGGLTKRELQRNPMERVRHPFDGKGGWFISFLIVAMSVVGTLTAVVNFDRGASLAASALVGAAVAWQVWQYAYGCTERSGASCGDARADIHSKQVMSSRLRPETIKGGRGV